jgi:hypothetical protein
MERPPFYLEQTGFNVNTIMVQKFLQKYSRDMRRGEAISEISVDTKPLKKIYGGK